MRVMSDISSIPAFSPSQSLVARHLAGGAAQLGQSVPGSPHQTSGQYQAAINEVTLLLFLRLEVIHVPSHPSVSPTPQTPLPSQPDKTPVPLNSPLLTKVSKVVGWVSEAKYYLPGP